MLNEKIQLSMCQLPNGYAVDIGKRKYMFYTVEDLLTGLFFHLGLQEYEYVDKNEIQALMQSISIWHTQKQAFKAAADMMSQNKVLLHKLKIAQATISGLRKKCDALHERIESIKK